MKFMKKKFFTISFIFLSLQLFSQFHPASGIQGTNAIHKDSSIIASWAANCLITRGYIDISDTNRIFSQNGITSNKAFYGDEKNPIGYPENINDAVSLGDGGTAILTFENSIFDGEGYDFVVFENGLKSQFPPYNYFLELAFVEVSSNGIDFVRFPAISKTQTEAQISTYGQLEPEKINNLAGKFIVDFGTPFDLNELKEDKNIDIQNITHIKIVDVVGSLNDEFCSYDVENNKINDPFPTPFHTCGFDLSGIGVINLKRNTNNSFIEIYPNPVINILKIQSEKTTEFTIYDINGKKVISGRINLGINEFDLSNLDAGVYIFKSKNSEEIVTNLFLKL